jgi:hypothetical protein
MQNSAPYGYDLFWRVLELTVPAFNPTVPLQAPSWDHDSDILDFGRHYELYFRLQAKKQVYFNTRDHTTMFLKAVTSTKYANIVTSLKLNSDSYRHPDNEYFLPQNYCLTNIAMLIHTHTKAQTRDSGLRCINPVAGWDSMSNNTAQSKATSPVSYAWNRVVAGWDKVVIRVTLGGNGLTTVRTS